MERRIAAFIVAGMTSGVAHQSVPALIATMRGLAREYRVSLFSLESPEVTFSTAGYSVHHPPSALSGPARKARWAYLASQFAIEHQRHPYGLLFSFWAYPMGTFVVALAKLARRPSIVTVLGAEAASVPSIGYGFLRSSPTRRLVLETCAHASAVVVLSGDQREALRAHGLRRHLEVIPFGADANMFRPAHRPLVAPLKILHVANLTPVKDQSTLLRGFALLLRHIDARLRIVGSDHMNGRIHRLAAELGVQANVDFVGPIPHAMVPSHHRWADMFVMTSLAEGQNVAATEAAMSGLLLVGTPVGCVRDLGEDAAVHIRMGDPADLAAKVLQIASDPDQWRAKVARARAWAESHDMRWTIEQLRVVIDGAAAWR